MLGFFKKIFRPKDAASCFGRTDAGMVRPNNEDNFSIILEKNLFIVADGMGGHKAGEVASRVAVETLVDFFSDESLQQIQGNPLAIQHALISSFHQANRKVMEMASEDAAMQGMGCTLIACFIDEKIAYVCHVGDVRAYLFEMGRLDQITCDHSLMADQTVALQNMTAGAGRNVVTRSIGFPFPQEPEFHRLPLRPGNKILLCSDGLWSMVADGEICSILEKATGPKEACDNLIHQANQAGGEDNITAVVAVV